METETYLCNYINGEYIKSTTEMYIPVTCPQNNHIIAHVPVSTSEDIEKALQAAEMVFPKWKGMTIKSRAAIMYKFHELLDENMEELAKTVVLENGKNYKEAIASIAKGNETVEYACTLPQLVAGKMLYVSRGITCHEIRQPLGIVACIVPFNFPIMVPMWTIPIALTLGNCVILKPSEKVPMTMYKVANLLKQAGLPDGVFQIVNGTAETVNALIDNPKIKAVSFVGSSEVAEKVSKRCRSLNKRVLALGGAKNHLVALPDADPEVSSQDIVVSYAGCAGQRCMAASVLLLVGNCDELLQKVVEKSKCLKAGCGSGDVGPVIDLRSRDKILHYINESEKQGAKIVVDGRHWANEKNEGWWIGPTIILHSSINDPAMKNEIFGPVLSVYKCQSFEEAVEIENSSEYGNAACIYTSVGLHAEYFQQRFHASMIGVNIGIPVPREPFSFGGLYGSRSKYGDMDITGDGAIELFTNRQKITTKWIPSSSSNGNITFHESSNKEVDNANFAGQI